MLGQSVTELRSVAVLGWPVAELRRSVAELRTSAAVLVYPSVGLPFANA